MKKDNQKPQINNLVAKHARNFNKASVMRDRKNDYQRKKRNGNSYREEE